MSTILLAIDDAVLPFRQNACLYLSKPRVHPQPVLTPGAPGAPDDAATHFYGTVLFDEGRYRLWYYACHWGKNPDWSPRQMQQVAKKPAWFTGGECPLFQGPLCYAESDDGIVFEKPALGQVLFKGSRANNALALPHTIVSGALVIRDDSDPDPARRYKMAYQFFPDQTEPAIPEYGAWPSVTLATSPDGLRWTVTAIPYLNQFVEPSSFIRHQGQYMIHYQVMQQGNGYGAEGGSLCGRTGVARISPDFNRWPNLLAEAFALPEPEDRSLRGFSGPYDQVHLGVGAFSQGSVCVGLYGLWHNAEFMDAFGDISCDFGLLVSNDGIRFREPVKGARFLTREESPVTAAPGVQCHTILSQANGILNVGAETRIYHGRWRNAGNHGEGGKFSNYYAEVALATLPRDRWGAWGLNPNEAEGTVCSVPIALPPGGGELVLNAEATQCLSVELLDEQFVPIPGFAGGKANGGDQLDGVVRWKGRDLCELGGRRVRIQVRLTRSGDSSPRLYALYVQDSASGQAGKALTPFSGPG
jgi:hypothetical protein